jgi:hypothetical protein
MALLDVPRDFLRRLKDYDSDLDCRWSDHRSCWLIERRIPERSTLMGGQGHVDIEDHTSAAARKIILFEVERKCLDRRVFDTLYQTDMRRQGNDANSMADEIDKRYFAAIAKSDQEFREYIRHHARERFKYKNTIRCLPESAAHTAPVGGMSING